jgi:hypothetical protein
VGPLTYPGDIPGYCNNAGVIAERAAFRYFLAAATPAADDEAVIPDFHCVKVSPIVNLTPVV